MTFVEAVIINLAGIIALIVGAVAVTYIVLGVWGAVRPEPYCKNCGSLKEERALPLRYNPRTGEPVPKTELTCPNAYFLGSDCTTPPPPPPEDRG